MKSISRRSFVAISSGALAAGSSSGATNLPLSDERRSLPPAGGNSALDTDRMCLVERLRPDGGWEPSARLFKPSDLQSRPTRAADGRWYLNSGERVSFVRCDLKVRVEVRKVARSAAHSVGTSVSPVEAELPH